MHKHNQNNCNIEDKREFVIMTWHRPEAGKAKDLRCGLNYQHLGYYRFASLVIKTSKWRMLECLLGRLSSPHLISSHCTTSFVHSIVARLICIISSFRFSRTRPASHNSMSPDSSYVLPDASSGAASDTLAASQNRNGDANTGDARSQPSKRRKKAHSTQASEFDNVIDSLPIEKKTAYLQAKSSCPELLEKESNPQDYLRFCDSSSSAAALQLVAYWQRRFELFGKRAFLPSSQTGEGTLGKNEITMLGSGLFLVLPSDKAGKPVVCFDSSRVAGVSSEILRRVAFYIFSVAAEIAKASGAPGFVLLCSVEGGHDVDPLGMHTFSDILQVLPCRVESVHVMVGSGNRARDGVSVEDRIGVLVRRAFGLVPDEVVFVHRGSRADVLKKLQACGLRKECLPKPWGGWGIERFVQWMELRTRFEWDLPPAASHKRIDKVFDFSKIKQPSELGEEERVERSRRMNVLHSRRKRERERVEIEVLHEQCAELRAQNSEARQTHEQLKHLLEFATMKIARLKRGDSAPLERVSRVDGPCSFTGLPQYRHSQESEGQSRQRYPDIVNQMGSDEAQVQLRTPHSTLLPAPGGPLLTCQVHNQGILGQILQDDTARRIREYQIQQLQLQELQQRQDVSLLPTFFSGGNPSLLQLQLALIEQHQQQRLHASLLGGGSLVMGYPPPVTGRGLAPNSEEDADQSGR